jgi:hypothetical protein
LIEVPNFGASGEVRNKINDSVGGPLSSSIDTTKKNDINELLKDSNASEDGISQICRTKDQSINQI